MAMNKYMHPRNPYKKPPDFTQLSIDYPALRKFVKPELSGKVKLNFKCEGAVRELTKCLLHRDFNLVIDIPPDRLVPTLPLRLNYLLWIEDLLNEDGKHFHGVDIGTGASCIYPLLGSRYFNWKMLATEINPESVKYAVSNVEKNSLDDLITVREVKESEMLDTVLEDDVQYDFCMCNPPFYCDEGELTGKARTDRRAPPRNHHSGQNFELVSPGGETAFISRIIEDSVKLKTKIRVYTVMVGHKSNLSKVKELVKKVNPVKIKVTEFCQGRTTRWGLAWTFSSDKNLISSAIQPRKDQSKQPYRWFYPHEIDLSSLGEIVSSILKDLDINIDEIENEDCSIGLSLKAYRNTWSHSRRKRREERRKLIEQEVTSPCDSVVTVNSSVETHDSLEPPSPAESLGYSSLNDLDDEKDETCASKNNRDVNITTNSDQLDDTSPSNSDTNFNEISANPTQSAEGDARPHSNDSKGTQSNSVTPGCSKDITDRSPTLSDATLSLKRKHDEGDDYEIKKMKSGARPLLEAILVISDHKGDKMLSLSFIDGTGGRDSANQVFQHLKNKLTS